MEDVLQLPSDGRAAGQARRWVQQFLLAWDLPQLSDAVLLLTSELVTNVLIHTTAAPRVHVRRAGPGVLVSVSDDSPVPPAQRRHSGGATTGRGVRLVAQLADDWGWRPEGGGGKSVWFVVTGARDPWAAHAGGAALLDAEL